MVLTKWSMAKLRNQSWAAISRKEMWLRPTRWQSGAAMSRRERMITTKTTPRATRLKRLWR